MEKKNRYILLKPHPPAGNQEQVDLDRNAAATLEETLHTLQREKGAACLFDLTNVAFLDVAILRLLVKAHHTFQAQQGVLILLAPSPFLLRLLKTTHLDAVFTTAHTIAEAEAMLPAPHA